MRRIQRLSAPPCLESANPAAVQNKLDWYTDLKDPNGRIHPRWNTVDRDEEGVSSVRRRLLEMSSYQCAYCGRSITSSEMEVDHFLPKGQFEYLAYCWENLLPACSHCNQRLKGAYCPPSLRATKLIDPDYATQVQGGESFEQARHLGQVAASDRLIEPTYEDPELHLEFNPEFFSYKPKTPVGIVTNRRFFARREVAEKWQKLSTSIRDLVELGMSSVAIDHFIEILGFRYVCGRFLDHWRREKAEGRI